MTGTVGIFTSEDAARDAVAKLAEAGFEAPRALTPTLSMGREVEDVRAARDAGAIVGSAVSAAAEALREGRSLVAVNAPFGRGLAAAAIMESCGAIERDALPPTAMRDPSPLSDALNIPTLTEFTPMTNLANSRWSLSKVLGLPLLSRNPAPLSSMFGMKLLTTEKHKTSSFGMPLLSNNPAPLSSLFGMKLLTRHKHKTSSFGFPLLSDNAAPLSSLFSLRLLTDEAKKKR